MPLSLHTLKVARMGQRLRWLGLFSSLRRAKGWFSVLQGQAAVYAKVAPLVERVAGGTNACILAYGAEGSGKGFTLAGTPQQPGINLRAIQDLFRHRPAPSPYAR